MALDTDARNLGTGPDDATGVSSDAAGQPSLPATRPEDAVTTPIVVANSLWQAADPAA